VTDLSAPPALVLRGVRRSFTTTVGVSSVLAGVDLVVPPGEVVAIAGRSGSGKTTLLMIITGWDRPDAGTVSVGGAPVGDGGPAWSDLAILPQSLGLLDELTLSENVGLPRRLAPDRAGGDPAALMEQLGIAHLADRYPDEVSLGEQQRAALARAATVGPHLLVADEPISHQNREWARVMMSTLRDLATEGTACVLATHDPIAFAGADRVLDLRDGRLRTRPDDG
jgi:putative ABC transport system ATP-binding protein